MARSKAYLFGGVEIRWKCDPSIMKPDRRKSRPRKPSISRRPADFLRGERMADATLSPSRIFAARSIKPGRRQGGMGGGLAREDEGFSTPIATPSRHRRAARTNRACATRFARPARHAERRATKSAAIITADDVMAMLRHCSRSSSASRNSRARPRTSCPRPIAQRLVERAIKTPFDHWLTEQTPPRQRSSCSTSSSSAPRNASAARTRKSPARRRRASCACPASSPIARGSRRRRHRIVHRRGRLGRRLGQAGAQPRDPGHPAPARQDPERRLATRDKLRANRKCQT
jgi:hypothetical protein